MSEMSISNIDFVQKRCRACFEVTKQLLHLDLKHENETYKDMFYYCTSIALTEGEQHNTFICEECHQTLLIAYKFKQKCLFYDTKFKTLLHNSKITDNSEDVCDTIIDNFDDNLSCSSHTSNTKDDFIDDSKNYNSKSDSNQTNLSCKVCDKIFSRSTDVERHMTKHTGHKPYVCNVCSMGFTQSGSLSRHLRRAHKVNTPKTNEKKKFPNRHLCSLCGKNFKTSYNLTLHVRRHTGDKPYTCKICNLSFVSSGRLTSHSRIHTGERPFHCKICNKNFSHSSVLYKHQQSHKQIKPYICDICKKEFTSSYSLLIHKRLHTGERPHKCLVCQKSFADPKLLRRHGMVHQDEKLHLCNVCGQSFKRGNNLRRHIQIHNKISEMK